MTCVALTPVPVAADTYFMPPEMVSLYETPLWERLDHRQRVELSKHELCSIASFGIAAELALMGALVTHAGGTGYDTAHWAYALTEIEDECRHSKMFARMIGTFGLSPFPAWLRYGSRLSMVVDDPLPTFAGVLLVEEFTDALQRVMMADENLHPIGRQVARIHVIEEARHTKYAREELKRQVVRHSATRRRTAALAIAGFARITVRMAVHPSCYSAVGLDPRLARKAAKAGPHRIQTLQWMLAKFTGFMDEVGFLDGPARRVWNRAGLL
ncbi:MAG: AurF N-oxygenase family protein [Actinomadura sp.]